MASITYYLNESNFHTSTTISIYRNTQTLAIVPSWNSVRVLSNRPSYSWGLFWDSTSGEYLYDYNYWQSPVYPYTWYFSNGTLDRIFSNFGTINFVNQHIYWNGTIGDYSTELGATISVVVQDFAYATIQLLVDGSVWRTWGDTITVTSAGDHSSSSTLPTDTPTKSGYTFVGWQMTEFPYSVFSAGSTIYYNCNPDYTPVWQYNAVWKEDNTSNCYANVSGTWKRVQKIYANQSGVWKEVKSAWGNQSGVWKKSQ